MNYRLIKDYPGKSIGDTLHISSDTDYYIWEDGTTIDKRLVETYSDFFEPIIGDWKNGDTLYYLAEDGEIIDTIFNTYKHGKLVYWGNAFKTLELASYYQYILSKVMLGGDLIMINNNDLILLSQLIERQEWEESKFLLKKLLK